jgi:response regulator RpfG family c-di-GMP phosphodiesterase
MSYDLAYETAMGYGSADLWMDSLGAAEPEAELDVLFIGTDPVIAEVYRRKLELDGYRLTVVRSHAQARESVLRLVPDVIYLDLTRSPGSGMRTLHAIREDPATATTPVVLLLSTPGTCPVALGRHDFVINVPNHGRRFHRAGASTYGSIHL